MFSEEGDWVWSNKAAEWLGQRFLPHNPGPNSVKKAEQPKLRGEGSSTLAISIWMCSPAWPNHIATATGCDSEVPLQLSLMFLGEMLQLCLSCWMSKTWKVNRKRAEIIAHTEVVLWWFELQNLCVQSSHSHGAVWTNRMAVPQSWACGKSRSSHIDEGRFWSIPNAEEVYKLSYQHRNDQQAGCILHKGLKLKCGQKEGSSPKVIFREEERKKMLFTNIEMACVKSVLSTVIDLSWRFSPAKRTGKWWELSIQGCALALVSKVFHAVCEAVVSGKGCHHLRKAEVRLCYRDKVGPGFMFCFPRTFWTMQCDPSALPRSMTAP